MENRPLRSYTNNFVFNLLVIAVHELGLRLDTVARGRGSESSASGGAARSTESMDDPSAVRLAVERIFPHPPSNPPSRQSGATGSMEGTSAAGSSVVRIPHSPPYPPPRGSSSESEVFEEEEVVEEEGTNPEVAEFRTAPWKRQRRD